ncbi:MAG: hypothetical protein IJY27_03805 [Clostridia bacterium]|nr:hypothetical protein [Clostridia bacterium]
MKPSTKLIALLMSAVMLISAVMLTSCDTSPASDGEDTTTANNNVTTSADTTAAAVEDDTPSDLVMVAGGTNYVRVVRSDDVEIGAVSANCASDIHKAIKAATSVLPQIGTDWIKPGQEYDREAVEILVGVTEYSESVDTYAELAYGNYVVKVVGNKLVIAAYSGDALEAACRKVTALINSNAADGELVIPADTYYSGVGDAMLNALPTYENGTFNCTYECGGNATLVLINDTTPEEYSAYLTKLDGDGWEQYTTNTVSDNQFATYNNDKYTINLGYYDYEDSVRIIIEPRALPVGLKEDNVYEKVTTSQITMLGLEYTHATTGERASNGQSMIIRLEDGRFIIMDGGFNDNGGSKSGDLLIAALKEQSKDYLKSGEKITIAAWIITHAHGDHCGMIIEQYSKFKGMIVEKFLVNFMSDSERNRAINSSTYGKNWNDTEGSMWTKVITAAKALKADVHYVHVGQIFYEANVRMDILYTIESFAPKICNALNTTSLTIKMTFDTGDTFLMTGDNTGNGMEIAAKTFDDYMQCDMLQVAHHGGTPWGNESGLITAYKTVAPETLLWPRGSSSFANAKAKNYNMVLFSKDEGGQNNNFKECLVAGLEGEQVILPIPYTAGSATEIRLK